MKAYFLLSLHLDDSCSITYHSITTGTFVFIFILNHSCFKPTKLFVMCRVRAHTLSSCVYSLIPDKTTGYDAITQHYYHPPFLFVQARSSNNQIILCFICLKGIQAVRFGGVANMDCSFSCLWYAVNLEFQQWFWSWHLVTAKLHDAASWTSRLHFLH
jgi:hypothetical protein